MRPLAALALVAVVVLAGCGAGPGSPTATPNDTASPTATTAGTAPPDDTGAASPTPSPAPADPSSDVLGWENGLWHNESIVVDRSDGLNDTELDRVVDRSMARVEYVRELEFERTVPVDIVTREEYRTELAGQFGNTSAADRLHQNVKFEALFMVNESTDALARQQGNLGSGVLGYYDPADDRIVIVSEDTESPEMNEITLAQELFHALQDQRFDVGSYDQSTEELHNARDGIIEGDGNYVDYRYEQRCGAEWDCLLPASTPGGGGDLHVGLYALSFTPYSEGPEFVRGLYEEGGWAAVNAVYEDPPASTEQIIHPEKYGEDEPTEVTIEDTSSGDWRVLDLEGGIDYAQFGEAGLFTMFWYASYQESVERGAAATVVVPYADFFEYEPGTNELEDVGPYSYAHSVSEGWDGDKLLPYVTDDSAATNETGYVWKLAWDSPAEAAEFADGYRTLLEHYGGQPVDGRADTYRIPDDRAFGDAYRVSQDGSTVVIVNAPTVGDLGQVREGAGR